MNVEFRITFIINLVAIITYSLGVVTILAVRKCPKMDPKAWWNLAVNLFSFTIKITTWSVILSVYDPLLEKQMGTIPYTNMLWDK